MEELEYLSECVCVCVTYSRMLVQLEGLTVQSLSELLLGDNLQGQRSEVTKVLQSLWG